MNPISVRYPFRWSGASDSPLVIDLPRPEWSQWEESKDSDLAFAFSSALCLPSECKTSKGLVECIAIIIVGHYNNALSASTRGYSIKGFVPRRLSILKVVVGSRIEGPFDIQELLPLLLGMMIPCSSLSPFRGLIGLSH